MKNHPQMFGNHAPMPPHATDKTCYQGRTSWGPSTYPTMGFRSTEEDGERALYQGRTMPYSPIESKMPTAEERGIASEQNSRGAFTNRK